jgi:hypothetical protein
MKQVASRALKVGGNVPPKRRLTFNRLHGFIAQKIKLFVTTAVKNTQGAQ